MTKQDEECGNHGLDSIRLKHAIDMVYRDGYAAGYYFTILHNENCKADGRPMMRFNPDDPEAVFRIETNKKP